MRADQLISCCPTTSNERAHAGASVSGVEYQGATYQIALEGGGAGDLPRSSATPLSPQRPVAIGDRVGLAWRDEDIHPLSPAS